MEGCCFLIKRFNGCSKGSVGEGQCGGPSCRKAGGCFCGLAGVAVLLVPILAPGLFPGWYIHDGTGSGATDSGDPMVGLAGAASCLMVGLFCSIYGWCSKMTTHTRTSSHSGAPSKLLQWSPCSWRAERQPPPAGCTAGCHNASAGIPARAGARQRSEYTIEGASLSVGTA